ncbi:acyltransferase [candidate division KSB1 bacterium]|nr:acyltransferase [candidate division KSB1 bacterium]
MKTLYRLFINKYRQLRNALELHKYDRFTIADYFRKQGAQIGDNCSIIPTDLGTEPYLIKIGNRVTIAANVGFMTHDGGAWILRDEIPDAQLLGPIIIEDDCVIGANAVILPNVRIGKRSIVATGSVVISDIPPESIAIGVPARVIGSTHKYRDKVRQAWAVQRPPDVEIEKGKTWWTSKNLQKNNEKLKKHLINLFWKT